MSRPRKRVLVFLAVLLVVIGLVQWEGLADLLNVPLGFDWSTGLTEFLRANTSDLVLLFVITIFFEFIGLERSLESDRQRDRVLEELLDASLSSSTNNALLEHVLAQEHDAKAARGLARYLAGDDDYVLNEFSVAVRVEPAAPGFLVTVILGYRATLERYVVGITSQSRDIEPMTIARAVTETFVVPPLQVDTIPNAPGSPVRVEAMSVGDDDGGTIAQLSFKKISPKARSKLLKEAGVGHDPVSCSLYEARPMRDLELSGDPSELRYTATFASEQTEPHTFWSSDRPLYVQSIDVDLSRLSDEQVQQADLTLFVGNVGWAPMIHPTNGRWSFPLERWLVAGHGIMVSWPKE